MAIDEFDQQASAIKFEQLRADSQSAWANYAYQKSQVRRGEGDAGSLADAQEAALLADRRCQEFYDDCQRVVAAQRQQEPVEVSDDVRKARSAPEMDAQDHADMWNGSKYAGLGSGKFKPENVYTEFAKLRPYHMSRGTERK